MYMTTDIPKQHVRTAHHKSRMTTLSRLFLSGLNPSFTKKGTVVLKSVKGNRAFFSQVSPLSTGELDKLKVC